MGDFRQEPPHLNFRQNISVPPSPLQSNMLDPNIEKEIDDMVLTDRKVRLVFRYSSLN